MPSKIIIKNNIKMLILELFEIKQLKMKYIFRTL